MARDAQRLAAAPGGHTGAATNSSAADLTPTASPSDQSLPRPANHHPRTPCNVPKLVTSPVSCGLVGSA
jgi:hypothetical protein